MIKRKYLRISSRRTLDHPAIVPIQIPSFLIQQRKILKFRQHVCGFKYSNNLEVLKSFLFIYFCNVPPSWQITKKKSRKNRSWRRPTKKNERKELSGGINFNWFERQQNTGEMKECLKFLMMMTWIIWSVYWWDYKY